MDGIHVVANLYRCQGEARYQTDAAPLRQFCIDAVNRSGLTVVGELFHQFDGGGVTGQAGAVRLGIARALIELDEEMRPSLKKAGLLTRDSRAKRSEERRVGKECRSRWSPYH